MNRNIIVYCCFFLVALVQWYFPVQTIFEHQEVLTEGRLYRFNIKPVDPVDLFRGRYVDLYFVDDTFKVKDVTPFYSGQAVYVELNENNLGHAYPSAVHTEKPEKEEYIRAEVRSFRKDRTDEDVYNLFLRYPFNKYFMEEEMAPEAEKFYREIRGEINTEVCCNVYVKNGLAVLEGIYVNGRPIEHYIEDRLMQKP